jgi:hypothetical protein
MKDLLLAQKQEPEPKSKSSAQSTKVFTPSNFPARNGTQIMIYDTKIDLNCPIGSIKNYMMPDNKFCNIYHQCEGNTGYVFVCDRGQAYDITNTGSDVSNTANSLRGACNLEERVNCDGKLILLENGQRMGGKMVAKNDYLSTKSRVVNENVSEQKQQQQQNVKNAQNQQPSTKIMGNYMQQPQIPQQQQQFQPPLQQQQQQQMQYQENNNNGREDVITGIPFDCRNKPNGHWKDTRFCDVFHACIHGEQRKTYSCAQVGDRTYFDEVTKRSVNNYYKFITFFIKLKQIFSITLKDVNLLETIQTVAQQTLIYKT